MTCKKNGWLQGWKEFLKFLDTNPKESEIFFNSLKWFAKALIVSVISVTILLVVYHQVIKQL